MEVEFLLDAAGADQLLERVRREKIQVLYARPPVDFGVVDGK